MMADITIEYFYPHVVLTLKETFTAKYNGVFPRTPEVWPKSEIYTTKREDEHPRPFHMGVLPRGWNWQRVKDRELRRVKNDDGGRDQCTSVLSLKKKGIQCQVAKKIHNHCVSSLSFSCSVQK